MYCKVNAYQTFKAFMLQVNQTRLTNERKKRGDSTANYYTYADTN